MLLLDRIYVVLASIACISTVFAIPAFEGVSTWSSIGSLVPGMSYLEAIGPTSLNPSGRGPQSYVSIAAPHGNPGNVTVETDNAPPLFYINNGHLWYYHNMTTILPMNVINSTSISGSALQLVVGSKQDGLKGGSFRWQGTMLYYDYGSGSSRGVYYSCKDNSGQKGLYFSLQPGPTPPDCTLFTVHSFTRQYF